MSQMILSIGMTPMVRLKNSSSIAWAETERNVGSSSSNLPNLRAPNDAALSFWPRASWAPSLSLATAAGSLSRLPVLGDADPLLLLLLGNGSLSKPALNSTIALMHANSCWSRLIAWKPASVSLKRFTSTARPRPWGPGGRRAVGSNVGRICAAASRNSSRHEDSSSVSWSSMTRFVPAAKSLAQWTFRNSNLAACSQIDSAVIAGISGRDGKPPMLIGIWKFERSCLKVCKFELSPVVGRRFLSFKFESSKLWLLLIVDREFVVLLAWPCCCSKWDVEGDDEGLALPRRHEVQSVVWAERDLKLLLLVGAPCWPSFRVL